MSECTSSNINNKITILGFGSLLSESSSRLTFPNLTNFRLGRVPGYRRVFAHPASIFFQRDIADLSTKEMSSLSAESCAGASFVCSVFEVPMKGLIMEEVPRRFCPSQAFREREEEFNIQLVPYEELDNDDVSNDQDISRIKKNNTLGVLCMRSTDEAYISMWGQKHFDRQYKAFGVNTIWNFGLDSGLRPCAVYLRHCTLAAQSMGSECYNSFLDETFLVDRTTTIRSYLHEYPDIMKTLPPPELATRYGG